jgi:hypothetical protein
MDRGVAQRCSSRLPLRAKSLMSLHEVAGLWASATPPLVRAAKRVPSRRPRRAASQNVGRNDDPARAARPRQADARQAVPDSLATTRPHAPLAHGATKLSLPQVAGMWHGKRERRVRRPRQSTRAAATVGLLSRACLRSRMTRGRPRTRYFDERPHRYKSGCTRSGGNVARPRLFWRR